MSAPPRVLWTAPEQRRTDAIQHVIDALPAVDAGWFAVTTHERANHYLATELAAE